MRKNITSIIGGVFCAGILLLTSCTKMDHFYKDYVVERTYIGKPDSIWVKPGENRVQVGILTPKDPAAQDLVVKWNGNADSVILPIDHSKATNSIILQNLEERDYVFNAYTRDALGNRSLIMELSSSVYGGTFRNTMREWNYSHSVVFSDSVVIVWAATNLLPETLLGNEFEYTDDKGVQQTVFVDRSEMTTILYDADPNEEVKVRSVYMPHANAFENFYTETNALDFATSKLNTLTFSSTTYTDAAYVDFNLLRIFPESGATLNSSVIDMAYALGAGSRGNLFTIDGTGFSAFAANWQALIASWPVRNVARMKLERGADALALYDSLDETNREDMVATFTNSTATASTRLSSLAVDDIILLHSSDRGLYVAIKVVGTPPNVSGALGDFVIEFKVSRPE